MPVLRCSACREKLWRCHRIGPGEEPSCPRDRIGKFYQVVSSGGKLLGRSGLEIGMGKGPSLKMLAKGFTCRRRHACG